METIQNYMISEHRSCDKAYAQLEDAIVDQDTENAKVFFKLFSDLTNLHLEKEEEILFPAFEEASGNSMGPTQVMRMEHTQMRDMIKRIGELLGQDASKENIKKVQGLLETLMILMQQHNMKEEQILYPMTDRALLGDSDHLITSMKEMG